MDPSQLRVIQRRVQTARQQLTKQKIAGKTVPESLCKLIGWCESQDFYAALRKHNGPADENYLPLFPAHLGTWTIRIS